MITAHRIGKRFKTRMHTSRMRAVRCSSHLAAGGVWRGGVSARGVCLPGGGVSAQGGICLGGGLPRGVSAWGVWGGVYPEGVSAQGVVCNTTPPPTEENHRRL